MIAGDVDCHSVTLCHPHHPKTARAPHEQTTHHRITIGRAFFTGPDEHLQHISRDKHIEIVVRDLVHPWLHNVGKNRIVLHMLGGAKVDVRPGMWTQLCRGSRPRFMHECVQVQLDQFKPDLTVLLGVRVNVDHTATRVYFKYHERALTQTTPHIDDFFPIDEPAPLSPSFHAWQNDGDEDEVARDSGIGSLPPFAQYADGGEAQPLTDDEGCTEEDQNGDATDDQPTQIDTPPVEGDDAGDVDLEEDDDGNIVETAQAQPTEQQHMTDDAAPSGWRKRKRA